MVIDGHFHCSGTELVNMVHIKKEYSRTKSELAGLHTFITISDAVKIDVVILLKED